ncbi:MAG: hypothetical protein M3P06_09290 [Acidobacteriota bacterium]|nr:hypothetical protein [Acidobacteriota bacterium]
MDATAKLVAIIALAAFATERILAAANSIINAERLYRVRRGAAESLRAKERRKGVLLALGAAIAVVVVDRADLRILRLLDVGDIHPLVDFWLTWLVVFAGADKVQGILKSGPAPAKAVSPERQETPVVRVVVDGDVREVRELHRVS